jgi:hypothetical protein
MRALVLSSVRLAGVGSVTVVAGTTSEGANLASVRLAGEGSVTVLAARQVRARVWSLFVLPALSLSLWWWARHVRALVAQCGGGYDR